jgi:beta-glucosidase
MILLIRITKIVLWSLIIIFGLLLLILAISYIWALSQSVQIVLWSLTFICGLPLLIMGIFYIWVLGQRVQSVNPGNYPWGKNMTDKKINQTTVQLLSKMTIEEKIAQLYGEKYALLKMGVGLIFNRSLGRIQSGYNERLNIPPFVFTDGPRGVVYVDDATCFPVAIARGASWDKDLEYRIGDVIGKEARAAGTNYFGGLCINLLRHPSWGRSQETFGEDPYHLGEMGLALMKGVQQNNVMACAKHYALNSIENSRFYVNVEADERTLREVYLPHFKKCVDKGLASIMSAYNNFRGELCGQNDYLMNQVLRNDWGFKGFVTSDWLYGLENTVKGIKAGMDVEMPIPKHYTQEKILKAIDDGEISEADIDKMVGRILRTKLDYITRIDPIPYPKDLLASEEHRNLARESAEKSMVLLKNEGNILPLNKAENKKIAVLGKLANVPNIGDHGSSWVTPPYVIAPLQGIKDYLGDDAEVIYSDGQDLEEAKEMARSADAVILVAGFEHSDEGEYVVVSTDMDYVKRPRTREEEEQKKKDKKWFELFIGGDRLDLNLKQRDTMVLEAVVDENPNIVVVLVSGGAITMEAWKDKVPGILLMWYAGMEGGGALANILFGEVCPSGKLPFTIPKNMDQLPFFEAFAEEIEYGYYHGYTLFEKKNKVAAFPFGFGLSYTQFKYEDMKVITPVVATSDTLEVSVNLNNIGDRTGKATTQLYIGFANSSIDRPVKILREFEKTSLEPGQSKTIGFSVPIEDLAWYNPESQSWEIEKMEYEVYVGGSSNSDDLLAGHFVVE